MTELEIQYWEVYKFLGWFDRLLCYLGICDEAWLVFVNAPKDSEIKKFLGKTKCFGASDA